MRKIKKAYIRYYDAEFTVSVENYPHDKIAYALNRLSVHDLYYICPTEENPSAMWVWKYNIAFEAAIRKLLVSSNIELEIVRF